MDLIYHRPLLDLQHLINIAVRSVVSSKSANQTRHTADPRGYGPVVQTDSPGFGPFQALDGL